MKSKDAISRAVARISAENRNYRETGSMDYRAARAALKGIVNVPSGRLTPQKKGAITRAVARVAAAARGGAVPVAVTGTGKKGAERRQELAKITGQRKVDRVFFTKPLKGERPAWKTVNGKQVFTWKMPAAPSGGSGGPAAAEGEGEVERTFIPYNVAAMKSGKPAEQLAAVLDAMEKVQGNALMLGAGPYVVGSAGGQGGTTFFDAAGIVAALSDMFDESEYSEVDEWATGLWDVSDPNLPADYGLGSMVEESRPDIEAEVMDSIS